MPPALPAPAGGATSVPPAKAAHLVGPAPAGGGVRSGAGGAPAGPGFPEHMAEGVQQLRRHLLTPLVQSPMAAVVLPPLMFLGGCCRGTSGCPVDALGLPSSAGQQQARR